MLDQPRICATKTGPTGLKQRMFQEEDGFDFREAATRRLISAELRRFLLIWSVDKPFLSKISCRCAASANHWSWCESSTAVGWQESDTGVLDVFCSRIGTSCGVTSG